MKIKLPFIEIETEKDCPCSNYEEYEVKIKCVKSKLHSKYLLIIATMICIWLFAVTTHGDSDFVAQISFASTITSIILSVLAIIMSITGEGKTEQMKEQLENAAKQINESQRVVNEINKSIEKNLSQLNVEIKRLSDKVDDVPHKTAQQVTTYQSENMSNFQKNRNINSRVSYNSWEKSSK